MEQLVAEYKGAINLAKWLCGGSLLLSAAAAFYSIGVHSARIEAHEKELAALKAFLEKVDGRLAGWEGRGFRFAQAFPLEGKVTALAGGKVTIDVEGKSKTFSLDDAPALKVGDVVRFMASGDDSQRLSFIELLKK